MPLVPITALPAAPSRLDEPATFVTKADAFVAALGGFVTETNDLAEYLEGLSAGTLDGNLAAIAGVTSAANTIPYFTGSETAALADFTAFGRTLVANADAATARTDLGLGTASTLDTDTDTTLAANSDTRVATQKAVKAYVDQNVADASNSWTLVDQSGDPIVARAATVSIASPGVVTLAGHGFAADTAVILNTTGALPTGLTAGTIYYVRNPATDTFELSATVGGASINTTGSQSGTHEVIRAASWVWSTNVSAVNFTGLAGATEFLVVAYGVAVSASGAATIQASTNNGSSYFSTSGDYLAIDSAGTAVNTIGATLWGTNSTAARYGQVLVSNPNLIGVPKTMNSFLPSTTPLRIFIADLLNDIDAFRVVGSTGGNLTAGRLYVYKKT